MQFEEPLFHIHLNVDYPFNLTGILYFPKLGSDLQIQKDKIQLYQNQVYVTDNVEGIVPELMMLKGGRFSRHSIKRIAFACKLMLRLKNLELQPVKVVD
jgi:hypothetical protein